MKKVIGVLSRSLNTVIVIFMIAIVLSIAIQFGFRPSGVLFHMTFYISLLCLIILMGIKTIPRINEITRDRTPFLVVNLITLIVVIIAILGLHFGTFQNETVAVVASYVALAGYMFTSLCIL